MPRLTKTTVFAILACLAATVSFAAAAPADLDPAAAVNAGDIMRLLGGNWKSRAPAPGAVVDTALGGNREVPVPLGNASGPSLDPGVADILTQKAAEVAMRQEEMGLPACLLVPDAIRGAISRLVRRVAPRLQVLAHSEIPETHTIRIGPILKGATA